MKAKRTVGFLMMIFIIGLLTVVPLHPIAAAPTKFVAAVYQEPTSMDPSLARSTTDYVVVMNWGEYLINRSPSGDLEPSLATSWKLSPDGKILEFALRKGVKFHSGDPLTSKDVLFSFDRGREKNPITRTRVSKIERIEIVDEFHLKMHLKVPDVALIPNQGGFMIVSKDYYDRVGEDKFTKEPSGTGPYKVGQHAPGEYVDVKRFDEYWGVKPTVKEARFYFVPEESTRVAKLKTGEVDMISNCPYPFVTEVEKSPELKIIKFQANHPTPSVVFGNRNPNTPWHDKRVRLAMAYAIDCDAIIKNVLRGIPNRLAFLAPYDLGYDPTVKPYPYNPERSKELLSEAGYPNGFDLTLYWPLTGYCPMAREVSEAIASYFEAIGIRTKLVAEEYLASLQRLRTSKTPEAKFVAYRAPGRAGGVEPAYFIDLFFGSTGGFSPYSNPELDEVIGKARGTVDDVERGKLIQKAVRIIQEDVASIPIFNVIPVYAMKKNIDFNPTQKVVHDLVLVKDVTMR